MRVLKLFSIGILFAVADVSTLRAQTDLPMATLDQRLVELDGAQNFRDLGGYPTKDGRVRWGQVYRSDKLDQLTGSDWDKIEDLGIDIVCDFRTDAERAGWPSNWPMDVDLIQRNYDLQVSTMERDGYHSLAFQQADIYRIMFDRLAEPDASPTLVHCTAGQDRTGFAAAFLLEILGVPRDIILDDYSLSQWLRGIDAPSNDEIAKLLAFYNIEGAYAEQLIKDQTAPDRREKARKQIETALDAIAEEYGSVMAFIREELQVDDRQVAQLRARLLEER